MTTATPDGRNLLTHSRMVSAKTCLRKHYYAYELGLRRDTDGQLQFVGENEIDHTPRNETIRVTTGNSFDLVGERKQTNFRVDTGDKWIDESFEIKLRNRKKEPVEFRVVEHLYRWNNWEITQKSDDFKKTDSQTVEFRVPVKPDEEKTITYTVHYSW